MTSNSQTERSQTLIKRGDIVFVDLEPVIGSEQGKKRPCIIVQNDIGNMYSETTIIVPLTKRSNVKRMMPIMVEIPRGILDNDSVALASQIRTISKKRIIKIFGRVEEDILSILDKSLCIAIGISSH